MQYGPLKRAFKKRRAHVAVVGLGYVGIPTVLAMVRAGIRVTGIDIDKKRVADLNRGKSFIAEIPDAAIREAQKKFRATTDWKELRKANAVLIAVPTPLTRNKTPDTSAIETAAKNISKSLRKGTLVVLESTTYPGTTEELLRPILEKSGLRAGKDFYLAFAPERVDPGSKHRFTDIPKVVGGIDARSTELAAALYGSFLRGVHRVSSPRAAEMTKLLENIFRLVNISLVNELKMIADKMGIDFWEVIEAAKTKPYGFMPFYPGPGVGGHCLEKHQRVVIEEKREVNAYTMEELYRKYADACVKRQPALVAAAQENVSDGHTLAFSKNTHHSVNSPLAPFRVASFDSNKGTISFERVDFISKRESNHVLNIKCHYNRELRVTDEHPLYVWDEGTKTLRVKWAKDLRPGEFLVYPRLLPQSTRVPAYDLIAALQKQFPSLIPRYRVKLKERLWRDYKENLDPCFVGDDKKQDYLKNNSIPLEEYLRIEKNLPVPRTKILLVSGRGSSFGTLPAILSFDSEWARLLGYYLSEGCITEDAKTMGIRWTFHSKEKEYIEDVEAILRNKGIAFSTYQDEQWRSFHIKVSSTLLALFFQDILHTGVDCYTMRIPQELFMSAPEFRKEVLAGILRGDGGVWRTNRPNSYRKNGRSYTHHNNSIELCYFTSSPILFEQVQLILNELGVIYKLERRPGLIKMKGPENARTLAVLFSGAKRHLVEDYLRQISKRPHYDYARTTDGYVLIRVKTITRIEEVQDVYSLEVNRHSTFLTNGGLAIHNCIPLDPFYLSWKAREYNFFTRFIDLAGEINELMPHHVVTKVIWALNARGKAVRGAKILVLGVAYKKDIDDPRESPAIPVIWDLLRKGARVVYNDPFVRTLRVNEKELRSSPLTKDAVKDADCVIILTDHGAYDYPMLARHAKCLVDTRGAIKTRGPNIIS